MQRVARAVGVVVVAVLATGCLVQVNTVSDPRGAFDRAREEARRVQGRPGPAHSLNALVYDPDDRKLIKVCVPMWMLRKAGDVEADRDVGDDEKSLRLKRKLERRFRLRDIEAAGLGILVEVEEEDGEQVLVWLR